MDDPSLFLRILAWSYLFFFLVVLICCHLGFRSLRGHLHAIERDIRKDKVPLSFRERIFRKMPPDERREFRRRLGPYWREWRFWAFFVLLDFVLLWVFVQTLPGRPY